ncbi:hypothetical protein Anae109_0018 [Anaeromyxobacter sp. Fw109-5]|nr:hypothetical protein Anae109_0018 [Anaeromyxobacter sp. Fw109-5]
MRRSSVLMAALALALAACGPPERSDERTSSSAPVEAAAAAKQIELTSYTYGKIDGQLADQLVKVFSPKKWRGETDGPVLLSGASLATLTDDQKAALKTILKEGHAILITGVTQEQLVRAHDLIAQKYPSIKLSGTTPAELYVLAYPQERVRTLAIRSVSPGRLPWDSEKRYAAHAKAVAEWFQEHVRGTQPVAMAVAADSNYNVLPTDSTQFPFMHSHQYEMAAYYNGTCKTTDSCINIVKTNLYAWAVHNPLPSTSEQPTDYIVARVTGDINVSDCVLPLGGDGDRFAGYWLQQANFSAHIPDMTVSGYRLVDGVLLGDTAPGNANPDVTVNKGVSFSFGGSGTIGSSAGFSGAKPSAEVSKSLGFNFGVTYTNETQTTYKAMQTIAKVPADASNPSKVLWTWDSWRFVEDNIKPANHACGGPGLLKENLPSIIYGGGLSGADASQAEFVWALKPDVRRALGTNVNDGYTYLPVQVDTSMLLGWAFFWQDIGYCSESDASATGYHYKLGGKSIDIVGTTSSPFATAPNNTALYAGDGLAFDSGCGTAVNFGTIPLGNRLSCDGNHPCLNPGPPFAFEPMEVTIPLAPDPRRMTLTSIEPTAGPMGARITLRGTALNTATYVYIGGQPAPASLEFENGVPVITTVAPALNYPAGYTVRIEVQNAVVTSQDFDFTYTGMPPAPDD